MLGDLAASSRVAGSPRAARSRWILARDMMSTPRSVPTTAKRPPPGVNSMSITAASRCSEAACLPFSITVAAVSRIAWPSE